MDEPAVPAGMALWKKLWVLFTVLWVVVCALSAVTIYAGGDPGADDKLATPLVLAFVGPALVYLLGWLWARFGSKPE